MSGLIHRWIESWKHRWRRLATLTRKHGRSRGAFLVLHRLTALPVLRRLARVELMELLNARTCELHSPARVPSHYQIRQATEEDQAALTSYFGDPARVLPRFEQGAVCFIASLREEICAAVWLLPGPSYFSEDWDMIHCHLHVPARTAWSFDGKGTRLGAWGTLMAQLPEQLRRLNIDEVFTAIEYDNGESLRSHFSLGYRSLGLVGRVTLLGLTKIACRRWGQRWGRPPATWTRLLLAEQTIRQPGNESCVDEERSDSEATGLWLMTADLPPESIAPGNTPAGLAPPRLRTLLRHPSEAASQPTSPLEQRPESFQPGSQSDATMHVRKAHQEYAAFFLFKHIAQRLLRWCRDGE